jgi:hypothetical protein
MDEYRARMSTAINLTDLVEKFPSKVPTPPIMALVSLILLNPL